MKKYFITMIAGFMLLFHISTVSADEQPNKSEDNIPTVVVNGIITGKKIRNSAIVNVGHGQQIWWEGETSKIRLPDDSWITLKLVKVERGKLTFEIRGRQGRPPQFTVKLKQSPHWGLQRAEK